MNPPIVPGSIDPELIGPDICPECGGEFCRTWLRKMPDGCLPFATWVCLGCGRDIATYEAMSLHFERTHRRATAAPDYN